GAFRATVFAVGIIGITLGRNWPSLLVEFLLLRYAHLYILRDYQLHAILPVSDFKGDRVIVGLFDLPCYGADRSRLRPFDAVRFLVFVLIAILFVLGLVLLGRCRVVTTSHGCQQ